MKLALIGTGLIGSAFALGAKAAALFEQVVGIDPNPEHLQVALQRGIIDEQAAQVPADADAVLVAAPASAISGWITQLVQHPGIIMDVGSVKGVLLDQVREQVGSVPANYVPCHPIAGLERSGPAAAEADLFADHVLVLTPLPTTDAAAVTQVSQWWQQLGAKVERMDPWQHDITFATTSHLPHLVAFAYMQQVASAQLPYAAGGFRDFSRIAAADPAMWTAILNMNKAAVSRALRQLQENLTLLGNAVEQGDTEQIHNLIAKSQVRRREFDGPTDEQ